MRGIVRLGAIEVRGKLCGGVRILYGFATL